MLGSSYAAHKGPVTEHVKPIRVYVFYPSMNHRSWWVLLPGSAKELFGSEGAAVDFAFTRARELSGHGRPVEVLQEKISGSWMSVRVS
ncbi:hypothetical protein [Luteibacter sp. 22Crub2.1]|uniref:hypothetical protein n=1 Tax=Luteibacter sp. 22Crub2.1 TaxID=1283288 RepID=UPI0009A8BB27|nr:hypothetical protein [Luteibacter sp. 22Crub2.1]SKC04034.1 hypothetical protein SAMN05660880_03898 [Luteibacter sp. 22Crub2.1]